MEDYLRTDGILILKLIRFNMGVHVSRQLVLALFPLFHKSAERALEIRDAERLSYYDDDDDDDDDDDEEDDNEDDDDHPSIHRLTL